MHYLFAAFILLVSSPVFSQTTHEMFKDDITISCNTLKGLKSRLQEVSNEMQVYGNNEKIWHSESGCAVVPRSRVFTTSAEKAKKFNVFKAREAGFVGWVVTKDWLVPIERIAYTGEVLEVNKKTGQVVVSEERKATDLAWRPAGIFSRKDYFLPRPCMSRKRAIEERGDKTFVFGHQFITGHFSDDFARSWCTSPVRGKPADFAGWFGRSNCNCDCDKNGKRGN